MPWIYENVLWHPAYIAFWVVGQVVGFYCLWKFRTK